MSYPTVQKSGVYIAFWVVHLLSNMLMLLVFTSQWNWMRKQGGEWIASFTAFTSQALTTTPLAATMAENDPQDTELNDLANLEEWEDYPAHLQVYNYGYMKDQFKYFLLTIAAQTWACLFYMLVPPIFSFMANSSIFALSDTERWLSLSLLFNLGNLVLIVATCKRGMLRNTNA